MDPSPAIRAFTVEMASPAPTIPNGSSPVIEGQGPGPTETPFIETPITKTLETAQAAAELFFPDAIGLDAPASCGGASPVDCPGGTPLPPAEQLSVTSTRSVTDAGESRYDATVTSGVETLQALKVGVPLVGDCDLTMTSANGANPNWTIHPSLNFVTDASSGEYRIETNDLYVTGGETDDFTLSGGIGCALANLGLGFPTGIYLTVLEAHLDQLRPLCAAPGPAYLGRCP